MSWSFVTEWDWIVGTPWWSFTGSGQEVAHTVWVRVGLRFPLADRWRDFLPVGRGRLLSRLRSASRRSGSFKHPAEPLSPPPSTRRQWRPGAVVGLARCRPRMASVPSQVLVAVSGIAGDSQVIWLDDDDEPRLFEKIIPDQNIEI